MVEMSRKPKLNLMKKMKRIPYANHGGWTNMKAKLDAFGIGHLAYQGNYVAPRHTHNVGVSLMINYQNMHLL